MSLTNSPWTVIVKFFPARESLVSDIPTGDGKTANLYFKVYSPKIFVNYANKPSSEMYTRGFRSLIQLKRMELWIGRGGSIGAWTEAIYSGNMYKNSAGVFFISYISGWVMCLLEQFFRILTRKEVFLSIWENKPNILFITVQCTYCSNLRTHYFTKKI